MNSLIEDCIFDTLESATSSACIHMWLFFVPCFNANPSLYMSYVKCMNWKGTKKSKGKKQWCLKINFVPSLCFLTHITCIHISFNLHYYTKDTHESVIKLKETSKMHQLHAQMYILQKIMQKMNPLYLKMCVNFNFLSRHIFIMLYYFTFTYILAMNKWWNIFFKLFFI